MTRYSLKVPPFQILLGSDDITDAVVGFSFRHPLAQIATPLIWTGTIELYPVRSGLARSFFDDESNPQRWLSGLQPIDVYFNGVYWQRFRIQPSGYRFNRDTGEAEIEITDIIGLLDSYQPAADAPELKVGIDNRWNDLAVRIIQKQAQLVGRSVSVQTPPFGIGGIYRTPRTISGSYIKEAQKMAGERGFWMWSDKEVIKWAAYPEGSISSYQWRKSRKELLVFSRQQGLDPVVESVTVSATNEDIFSCQENFPRTTTEFANRFLIDARGNLQTFKILKARKKIDRQITRDVYRFTTEIQGSPSIYFFNFGAPTLPKEYKIIASSPITGIPFLYEIKRGGTTFRYRIDWEVIRKLSREVDTTTYEAVPLDSINASKILKNVVRTEEILANNESALINLTPVSFFGLALKSEKTTEYTYREIQRDDIIVAQGVKLFEIGSITETEKRLFISITKVVVDGVTINLTVTFSEQVFQRTITTYTRICQGRWRETVQTSRPIFNRRTGGWTLEPATTKEQEVLSIPEITYRPAPFPIFQKPLLATEITGYAGISPFVQSKDFKSAETLTTNTELARLARYYGRINWQRYYSREIASGYETVLSYQPFQGVLAGNGSFIRDRFGVSLNNEGDSWQFVEDCIGNKIASIPEIQAPPIPFPPLLTSTLNIGTIPNQSFAIGVPINAIVLSVAGGTAPYTFSATGLPTGLSISGNVISGTPSSAGTSSVTATVTDSLSDTDSTTFDIVVAALATPISITTSTIEIQVFQTETYTFDFLGGINIPISGGYDDTTTYEFNISPADVSNLVLPTALGASGGELKSLSSAIETANTEIRTNVGIVKIADSALNTGGVELGAIAGELKSADSALSVGRVELGAIAGELKSADSALSVGRVELNTQVAIPVGTDTNAQAVINAIEATGVTLTTTERNAITARIANAKADGVWTKWRAYYGFVGGTAAAHAINWKNPSQFLITWFGTLTHNNLGVKGDGSTGYGDTNINPSLHLSNSSLHLAVYQTIAKTNLQAYEIGALNTAGNNGTYLVNQNNILYFGNGLTSFAGSMTNANSRGYLAGDVLSGTGRTFINNTQIDSASFATSSANPLVNLNLFILHLNYSVTTINYRSNGGLGSAMISEGLTDAERNNNYASELAFQTALGRN